MRALCLTSLRAPMLRQARTVLWADDWLFMLCDRLVRMRGRGARPTRRRAWCRRAAAIR